MIDKIMKRLRPFVDLTAWVLLLASLVPLFLLDKAMVLTLVNWLVFGLAIAGVTVFISRMLLPNIDMSETIDQAMGNQSVPAAILFFGVTFLMGSIFIGLVLWSGT